jgi:CBS domain-containing protein
MTIGEYCNRDVVTATPDQSVREAALLMQARGVGDLVIVEGMGRREPVGMLTDRDVVLGVVAPGRDADTLALGEVMSRDIETVCEDAGVLETIERMRRLKVRRLPVVDDDEALVGIVTLDDLLGLLARELSEMATVVGT